MKIWDLPVRLFHWLLVVLMAAAWATEEFEKMDWHFRIGETILALLLFRIVWGFVGSDTARFANFLRSPMAALAHLAHLRRREPDTEIGHNAAGGWMVLGLLGLIGIQTVSGLFAHDEDIIEGPLRHLAGASWADLASFVHEVNFNLLLLAVVAHVGAVVAYRVLKGQNLVRPMITGVKPMPPGTAAPRMAKPVLAVAVAVVVACFVAWLVRL
jgi:cytochrome b